MQTERGQWDTERRKWAEETETREKVRLERTEDDKKKEKAKEKRKNAGIKWSKLQPDPQCLRHGMRKWTAHLEHLPAEYDPILMCSETKALIHGRWELPHVCEGNSTGPVGTWYIDFSEAACHTFWTPVRDKGCTSDGSGKRKYEAQLENLRAGDDWMIMCSSTPAEFRGLRFDGPHSCDDSGVWGYRGLWFVEDETCN
ncbi:hypothetical protein BKA70DRAFT_1120107 [Coprinopsis sp. MPI-PUGE-AT-0042]|nr:hypothetical protein BKA70DRAFT_1120107 [Coprinopsis sp. MPI-PUGE-AT-0042]